MINLDQISISRAKNGYIVQLPVEQNGPFEDIKGLFSQVAEMMANSDMDHVEKLIKEQISDKGIEMDKNENNPVFIFSDWSQVIVFLKGLNF